MSMVMRLIILKTPKNISNNIPNNEQIASNYKILSSLFLCVTWHRMFIKPNHRCMIWVARYMCSELAVWIGLFYFAEQQLSHSLVLLNFVPKSVSYSSLHLLPMGLLFYIILLTPFIYNYRNIFVYILFLLFQFCQWWVFLRLLWTLARSTLRQYFYLYLTHWWWVFLACSCERLLGLLWGKTLLYNSTTLLTDDEFS